MPIIEQTREYLDSMAKKELARTVEKTTSALLNLMRIDPHGCGLVLLCGKQEDKTNTDAVRTWVTNYLCCASCMRTGDIEEIANKLERDLNKKLGNF